MVFYRILLLWWLPVVGALSQQTVDLPQIHQHYKSTNSTEAEEWENDPSSIDNFIQTNFPAIQFEEFGLKPKAVNERNLTDDNDDIELENYIIPATVLLSKQNKSQHMEEGQFCRRKFDGRSGYCILAYQCLHVIREYRFHGVKIDICTYRKNIPVVCCPLAGKHTEDQRISIQKCEEYVEAARDIKIDAVLKFSNKFCAPSMPLIVGGITTRKDEYPHMAALGWTQDNKDIKWGCGGSLLSERFVLTAAHCTTYGSKAPDVVRLGVRKLNNISSRSVDRKILVIYVHPKYHSSSYYHDIALLKLSKRIKFSESIRPICLWQMSELNFPKAVAIGWGRTHFSGPKSDVLRKVNLDIINQTACQSSYRKERRLPQGIIDEQLCAGVLAGGKDTCQGDSGGPLIAELPEFNCVKFIIGITSFGRFCASPNSPGVYTKVYSYLDWIEQIVFPKLI